MQRLPVYILPTPARRRSPSVWPKLLPALLLAALVLAAFAVGGAVRSDADAPVAVAAPAG